MSHREGRSFFGSLIVILSFYSLSMFGVFAQSIPFQKNTKVPAAEISDSEASQVMVLGTVHLRTYGHDFNPNVLDGLLDVLEAYKPDIIGIESLSPIGIRDMVNSGEAYSDLILN